MQITREYLEAEIKSLENQRATALEIVAQANGAIQAMNAVIARLEAEEPSADPIN